jgi:transcriptional regulator with XRE-family HTH domain
MHNAGLSHRALAKAAGVSKQSVTNWLGETHEPRLSQVKKTAEALGVSVAYLVGEEQAQTRLGSPADDLIERFGELHASPAMRSLAPQAQDLFDLLSAAEQMARHRRRGSNP